MADDKPQKTSNFQSILKETEEVTVDEEGKRTTEIIKEIDGEKLEIYLKDIDNDLKKLQTYTSRVSASFPSVGDTDWDTVIFTERTPDEDKVRINIAGTETIVIDASGIAVSATQPAGVANALVKENIVKAWINLDATGTIDISDSYNVASVTDYGTGDFGIFWNVEFATTAHAVVGLVGTIAAQGASYMNKKAGTSFTTASVNVTTWFDAFSAGDPDVICLMAIGDQ